MRLLHPLQLPWRRLAIHGALWLVLLLVCLVIGAAVGLNPGLGLRVALLALAPMALAALFMAPVIRADVNVAYERLFGAFLVVSALWPRHAVFKAAGLPAVSPNKLMFALMFLSFLVLVIRSPAFRAQWVSNVRAVWPVLAAWTLFVLTKVVSMLADERYDLMLMLKPAIEGLLGTSLCMVWALALKADFDVLKRWGRMFTGVVLVLSLYGLLEWALGRPIFAALIDTEIDNSAGLERLTEQIVRDGRTRLQASFEHPLVFGQYLIMCMPLVLARLFARGLPWWERTLGLLAVGASLGMCQLSGSRSSIAVGLILLVLMGFYFLFKNVARKLTLVNLLIMIWGAVAFLIVIPLLYSFLGNVIDAKGVEAANSTNARVFMLAVGVPRIFDAPFLGHGIGQSLQIAGIQVSGGYLSIDNFYLSQALDHGIFIILAFLGVGFYAVWRGTKLAVVGGARGAGSAGAALSLGCLAFMATQAVLSIQSNLYLFFAFAAVACLQSLRVHSSQT